MLVICEDCAKKYSIDEQRINAPKVRFKCRACGHIIIVEKPTSSEKKDSAVLNTQVSSVQQKTPDHGRKEEDQQGQKKQAAKESSRRAQALLRHSATGTSKGVPFFVYLLAIILFGLMVISIIFVHFSLHTIPEVLQHQLELRSRILSDSLKGTITVPLSRKDYLTVNREVQRASTLPGVAYVAVGNKKGIVIAGFFNDLKGFDRNFSQLIKKKGFPADILNKNRISLGEEETGAEISIGGISLYDWASALPDLDGELHVGLYVDRFDKYFLKFFRSPLTLVLLLLLFFSAYLLFILLDKLIAGPMRSLTWVANRASLGELDHAIHVVGPQEIRNLSTALERMRHSIKIAREQRVKR